MSAVVSDQASKIRQLNDRFRTSLQGGRIFVTAGVQALGPLRVAQLLQLVRSFDQFDADNDPYAEHDFGAFEDEGERFFWKIDYYDQTLTYGSVNPADPSATTRVLTLMLAEEY